MVWKSGVVLVISSRSGWLLELLTELIKILKTETDNLRTICLMSFTDRVNLGTNCVKFEKTFHCSNPISNHLLQISKCRELRVFRLFFLPQSLHFWDKF